MADSFWSWNCILIIEDFGNIEKYKDENITFSRLEKNTANI